MGHFFSIIQLKILVVSMNYVFLMKAFRLQHEASWFIEKQQNNFHKNLIRIDIKVFYECSY